MVDLGGAASLRPVMQRLPVLVAGSHCAGIGKVALNLNLRWFDV